MSMLLFVTHRLSSIIGDAGSVVSSVGPSALAPLSFHMLTGNVGSRPPALTLPQVRYGLSLLLLEVFYTPGVDFLCRQVPRQLQRNELARFGIVSKPVQKLVGKLTLF
jgi:hypothetical protein